MQFFNNLLLKLQCTKLYKFLFGIFLFLLFFIPNVSAKDYLGGTDFSWAWNGWTTVGYYQDPAGQTVPKSFSLSSKTYSSNWVLSMYAFDNSMGYLYIDTCSNLGQYPAQAIISNSSYGTSYFESGTYRPFVDLGACQMGNTALSHHLVFEIPITKMYYSDNTYTVDSYLKFYNDASYSTSFQINYAYASDTKLSISQDMINKLNSINTAITNMQTSINSSITNSTNAINGNIDQEFNDLKNQDHSYNSNAKDTVPNSSDISSVTNAEDQLLNSINLDPSPVSVSFISADATNYVWSLVTQIRNVDPKITLLFTSILSLGIIKMVLNR